MLQSQNIGIKEWEVQRIFKFTYEGSLFTFTIIYDKLG